MCAAHDDDDGELSKSQVKKLKVSELRAELDSRGLETSGLKAELAERLEKALEEASLLTSVFVGSPAAAARERQRDKEREREKETEQETEQEREKERKEKKEKKEKQKKEKKETKDDGSGSESDSHDDDKPPSPKRTCVSCQGKTGQTGKDTKGAHKQDISAAEVAAQAGAKAAESVLAPMSAQLQTLTDMLQQQQQLISEGQKSRESALVPYCQTRPPARTSVPARGQQLGAFSTMPQPPFAQAQAQAQQAAMLRAKNKLLSAALQAQMLQTQLGAIDTFADELTQIGGSQFGGAGENAPLRSTVDGPSLAFDCRAGAH